MVTGWTWAVEADALACDAEGDAIPEAVEAVACRPWTWLRLDKNANSAAGFVEIQAFCGFPPSRRPSQMFAIPEFRSRT